MSYRVPEHIHFRNLHGEVVLLDTRTNAYLGLNTTGAAIWETLAAGGSAEEAVDGLTLRFEVSPDVARTDVTALIDLLLTRGVIEHIP